MPPLQGSLQCRALRLSIHVHECLGFVGKVREDGGVTGEPATRLAFAFSEIAQQTLGEVAPHQGKDRLYPVTVMGNRNFGVGITERGEETHGQVVGDQGCVAGRGHHVARATRLQCADHSRQRACKVAD